MCAPPMACEKVRTRAAEHEVPKAVAPPLEQDHDSRAQVPLQAEQRVLERLAAKTDSRSAKTPKRRRKDENCATVAGQQSRAVA